MICFTVGSPLDYLIYHPIVKSLEERKKDYIIYDTTGKSAQDIISFFTSNEIKSVINYGVSEQKLLVSLISPDYEFLFINLHGDETHSDPKISSISDGIILTGTRHFVSKPPSTAFLLEKGVQAPIGIFECPITHLSRKSQNVESFDILYIPTEEPKIGQNLLHFGENKYSYKMVDFSRGLPQNWKDIYSYLRGAKWIVSDSFIFDKPSRYLNKHFFYLGSDVLDHSNLGISTHLVSKKLELHDYLKQTWSPLEDINPKHGLQSLLQVL